MKPDRQLARGLQASKRSRVVTAMMMDGVIPDPAEIMEEIEYVARVAGLPLQAAE
ncbi:hypothetical protein [Dankookia sp. P2]|uniref:hypothetical protein n=1 Tax=Dankookia sp. P2 TaxID=3423955 RepID=UPI003D67F655